MNRQQRRHLAKLQGKNGGILGQAAGNLQQAVQALQSMQGLEAMTQQVAEAHQLIVETHTTVSALVEDYQGMADELEVLKTMVFQTMGSGAEVAFKRQLERLRAQRTEAPTPGPA